MRSKLSIALHALLLLSVVAAAIASDVATVEAPKKEQQEAQIVEATDAGVQANATRSARMVKYLSDPKGLGPRHPPLQKIRQRADFGPAPKRLPPNAFARPQPSSFAPPPPPPPPRPQVLRRVHNNALPPPPPPPRFGFDTLKSSYYSPLKLGPPQYANGGGANAFGKGPNAAAPRPQYANPNALPHPHAPSAPQQQQQHFKASPPFNGQAIVRPAADTQQQQQQPQPTPQQSQALQQQQPQVFPNHIDAFQQPPPASPLQRQQQQQYQYAYQQQQQQQPLGTGGGSAPSGPNGQKMYSVYEEPEHMEHATLQQSSQQQYGTAALSGADMLAARQAQDYIKFMNSNDYFLPKRDPNYKQLDAEKDRQHHAQQYQHQHPQHTHPHLPHLQQQHPQHQQHQQQYHPQQQQQQQFASFNQQPIQVPPLFYPTNSGAGVAQRTTPETAAIVRGSYQTGNNMFVVNSDGNKAVHHIVASPLPTQQLHEATTPTAVTSQRGELRYSAAHRRTPEPQRFEFTENDAMPSAGGYTSTPHTQLRYNNNNNNNNYHKAATTTRAPSVISSSLPAVKAAVTKSHIYAASRKSATEPSVLGSGTGTGLGLGSANAGDDVEDGDDVHEDNYSRKPTKTMSKKKTSSSSLFSSPSSLSSSSSSSTTSTTTPATAQKQDTEEYCERMCALVHDDNAEIVCGSDGYMYTSEAQMECYASCLHIDVTIQSKGSCTER